MHGLLDLLRNDLLAGFAVRLTELDALCLVEGCALLCGRNIRFINVVLTVKRTELIAPELFPRSIESARFVTKEINIEWLVAFAGNDFEFAAYLRRVQYRAGQGTKASGVANRYRKRAALDTGHRCLNDGQFKVE